MNTKRQFVVRVVLSGMVETDSHGYTFGPFVSRDGAEKCLVALAARTDVRSAAIEEVEN